jgi:hypothetical protein
MSKNFEKFNKGNNNKDNGKKNKKTKENKFFTKEEIDYDLFLDANMRIFSMLMQSNREFAESIKDHYEEFINDANNYFHQNKTLHGFLEYIEKTKPNNFWIYAASGVIEGLRYIHKDRFNQWLKKFIDEFVKRKIRGKDIQ